MTKKNTTMKDEAAAPAEAPVNEFAVTLASIDKGNALAELSSALLEVVQACRATGKKGEITYKLVIKPVANTDGAQVVCVDELKVKVPKPERKATLFFTTEEGRLSRKDPNQVDWIDEAQERAEAEAAQRREAEVKLTRADLEAAAK